MLSLGTFLVYMFQLAVGPTATDAKQFELLKGEWQIERVVSEGVVLPAKDYKGRTIVFAGTDQGSVDGGVVQAGRLRTKGNMAWLETRIATMAFVDGKQVPQVVEQEYSSAYQIDGKKMKLLMNKVTSPSDRGPRPITETKEDKGILFYLKRK